MPSATDMLSDSLATSSTTLRAIYTPSASGKAASKAELKAAAHKRDFEHLNAALANSEILPEELHIIRNLGQGSSGLVQKVLHVPSDSVLALKARSCALCVCASNTHWCVRLRACVCMLHAHVIVCRFT